ncbi:DUF5050 domain-containing protein [Marinisporobacter balticus]|uniref:Uncharacterized protein DUF5050 n=1 Tax=Marinisporobacter balticus TaxID=2018667 RepID=A0A4R2KA22_9FIRM|nr:DUF5050 domain-containing protein [Marinisporobacter balticus]TCO69002.1 uncharacterized protein DUF5050 [Marinisporobacter balticus]
MEEEKKTIKRGMLIFYCFVLLHAIGVIKLNVNIFQTFHEKYYDFKIKNVKKLHLSNDKKMGNIEGNINNYGHAVENDEYIFYLKDNLWLYRSDKEFKNGKTLVRQGSGNGICHLNIIGDYLLYMQGDNLIRRKIDGSEVSKVPMMDFTIDPHVIGDWIYFIKVSKNNSGICKMTINGENFKKISNVETYDMALYNGKIYYSFEYDKTRYLNCMDLDGNNKKVIVNVQTRDMIIEDNYIYYVDEKDYKLYKLNLKNKYIQLLVDEKVSKFCKNDIWIYYSKYGKQPLDEGEGLYKIDENGIDMKKINDDRDVENLSVIGKWIMYMSSEDREYPTLKRISKNDEIIPMN